MIILHDIAGFELPLVRDDLRYAFASEIESNIIKTIYALRSRYPTNPAVQVFDKLTVDFDDVRPSGTYQYEVILTSGEKKPYALIKTFAEPDDRNHKHIL